MTLPTIMSLLSILVSVPLAAFCLLLSRRLRRLNDLESGLGGAIAVMTGEISRLDAAIRTARAEAEAAASGLADSLDQARTERSYWALQAELTRAAHVQPRPPRRLRPRREEAREDG